MSNVTEIFLLALAGLVPIINPLSTAPLFVTLTNRHEPLNQAKIALLAPLFAFFILVFFLITGDMLIAFFGISIAGIRIAGGIVIGIIGLQMLFPHLSSQSGAQSTEPVTDESLALSPLAIPSISGPGSIAVVLSIGSDIPNDQWLVGHMSVVLAIALVMLLVYVTFLSASFLARRVGQSLIDGITRIMGFLLIALAVQFVAIGFSKYQAGPSLIKTVKYINEQVSPRKGHA